MNPWPFITGAYALTALATVALTLASWISMRRAEAEAAALSERP
ncbi:MAG TPA: heme exporter protein CcmD [Allosphingosinicella sp.]|nr:heme exporter protein CcmD [Allosphingosinicella sp.]